jgi:hypothetical protein
MSNNQRFITEELRTYDTPLGVLPSVTTILKILNKPALIQWGVNLALSKIRALWMEAPAGEWDWDAAIKEAKSEHRTVLDEAADLGSQMHKLIQDFLAGRYVPYGEPLDIPSSLEKAWSAWLSWLSTHNVKQICLEQEVYHKSGFAGTLDFYGLIDGKRYVVDFKSSGAIWPEMAMQVAAYAHAWRQMTGDRIDGCAILRLDKKTGEPEYRAYTKKEIAVAWKKFKFLLGYFLLENGDKLREKENDKTGAKD